MIGDFWYPLSRPSYVDSVFEGNCMPKMVVLDRSFTKVKFVKRRRKETIFLQSMTEIENKEKHGNQTRILINTLYLHPDLYGK